MPHICAGGVSVVIGWLEHGENVRSAVECARLTAQFKLPTEDLLTLGLARRVECFVMLRSDEVRSRRSHDVSVSGEQLRKLRPTVRVTLMTAIGVSRQVARSDDLVTVVRSKLAAFGEYERQETPKSTDTRHHAHENMTTRSGDSAEFGQRVFGSVHDIADRPAEAHDCIERIVREG